MVASDPAVSVPKGACPPFFLFGFERSGTTLLSVMVGAHPRIAVPFSLTGLWYRYGGMLDQYGDLRTRVEVERIVGDLLLEERIRLWDVTLSREEILAEPTPGSFPAIVKRFHQVYARHKNKDVWGNIDIATLLDMDQASRWFPTARFIHIVRDGRDVALSHKVYPYGASNIAECAIEWRRRVELNLKMGAILGPQRYLVVHYEDLVLDPETSLRRVCEFLDVAYSPTMLEYRRFVEGKIPEDRRWLWPLLDKPLEPANAHRWRQQMTTTERIVFEDYAGTLLGELGYEVYSPAPKRIGAYALDLWCFVGRGGRLKRLAKKLGLGDRRPSSARSAEPDARAPKPIVRRGDSA